MRIIDHASGPAGESRARGIHARTLKMLELCGVTPWLLVRRSVVEDQRRPCLSLDFSRVPQKVNFVLMLLQSDPERLLEAVFRYRVARPRLPSPGPRGAKPRRQMQNRPRESFSWLSCRCILDYSG